MKCFFFWKNKQTKPSQSKKIFRYHPALFEALYNRLKYSKNYTFVLSVYYAFLKYTWHVPTFVLFVWLLSVLFPPECFHMTVSVKVTSLAHQQGWSEYTVRQMQEHTVNNKKRPWKSLWEDFYHNQKVIFCISGFVSCPSSMLQKASFLCLSYCLSFRTYISLRSQLVS